MPSPQKPDPRRQPSLPIAPPEGTGKRKPKRRPDGSGALPDLHIEEIEDRHVPKDRNIFDK